MKIFVIFGECFVNMFTFVLNITAMNEIIKQLLHVNNGQKVIINETFETVLTNVEQLEVSHLYSLKDLGDGRTRVVRLSQKAVNSPLMVALHNHDGSEVAYKGNEASVRVRVSRFNTANGTRFRVRQMEDGFEVYLDIQDRTVITREEYDEWDAQHEAKMLKLENQLETMKVERQQMMEKAGILRTMPFKEDEVMEVEYEDIDQYMSADDEDEELM